MPSSAFDLRRRAAEEYLKSGHVREGLAVLKVVLGTIGERMAPTPQRATLRLLFRRAAIRVRGLSYRERSGAAINPLYSALKKRGYSEADIKKIMGENFLRVMREVIGK